MSQDKKIEHGCVVDLTVGCVFQNEAPYLKDWIEFHKMMGVQRFILVNDRSVDGFADVLLPYIEAGIVECFNVPCPARLQGKGWIEYQLSVVRAILRHVRGVSRWLALIDIDEFIVPAEGTNLLRFLQGYEEWGGVYVRWEPFGTSYIQRLLPGDLVTEKFHLKWKFVEGFEMLGKSIVKPHRVSRPNIHQCDLLPGYACWDSNPGMKSSSTTIRINHYWSRDEHYLFNVKLPRTAKIKGWDIDDAQIRYFTALFNDVPDRSMRQFSQELRVRVYR